jgi:hypothetical protein
MLCSIRSGFLATQVQMFMRQLSANRAQASAAGFCAINKGIIVSVSNTAVTLNLWTYLSKTSVIIIKWKAQIPWSVPTQLSFHLILTYLRTYGAEPFLRSCQL